MCARPVGLPGALFYHANLSELVRGQERPFHVVPDSVAFDAFEGDGGGAFESSRCCCSRLLAAIISSSLVYVCWSILVECWFVTYPS